MQTIPLQAISNQELTVTLDGILYDIVVRSTNGCMSLDITRGGIVIVQGQRAVTGQPILPYVYLESTFGNFVFLTNGDDLPDYTQFGVTQTLVFATEAEINAIRLSA